MERLLSFENGVDVAILDEVINKMNYGSPQERQQAQAVLTQFQEHPDSWITVDKILDHSGLIESKYYALQVLEKAIKFRWKILPENQKEGIKTFLVNLIIRLSQDPQFIQPPDPQARRMNKVYLNKLDLTLVALVKQEWPDKWQGFIPEIVNSSKTNESLCENNMTILKLLSEEVFDFGSKTMTKSRVTQLKQAYNNEFALIFQLCDYVLQATTSESLVITTLKTLQQFLSWIPVGYIFETNLIETILLKYFVCPQFRLDSLKCLVEIGTLSAPMYQNYQQKHVELYRHFLEQLKSVHLPPHVSLTDMWENGDDSTEEFLRSLALFLSGFFRMHLPILELECSGELMEGMDYLVKISKIGDWELLKISVDFWNFLAENLYQSEVAAPAAPTPLMLQPHSRSPRWVLYCRILSEVRRVVIENMAKPEEVLVVEDENGEIVREQMQDSDVITMYKTMRETLVYLTHLDNDDTENIMLDKLCRQVDGSEWSWNNLNTLCWAVGSISGAINQEKEKNFLVTVIKDLLSLCEMKRGKDNKAVVASNIMYVVGQYPRFLRDHWKFLKTVVNKLFEFMHETHPGVQDMACDTFLKISQKCKRKFVIRQQLETSTFVDELLKDGGSMVPISSIHSPFTLRQVIAKLEPHQIHTVYEAVATMISALTEAEVEYKETLITALMALPNQEWHAIIQQAQMNPHTVVEPGTIASITNILRINSRACSALGMSFRTQILMMYDTMLTIYKLQSESISAAVAAEGAIAAQHSKIRSLRTAKRDAIKFISTFIRQCHDVALICQQLVPPLMEPLLADYARCVPDARNPEVLLLFATIINQGKQALVGEVPRIMTAVFECTLQMITQNFSEFPDHRTNFFQLMKAITQHCFEAYFQLPDASFKLVIDSICWGIKHTDRTNSELGLTILQSFLERVEGQRQVAEMFYQRYFVMIMQEVFYVLTDTFHKPGFKQQSTILIHMFDLVESARLQLPIFDPAQHPNVTSNKQFLHQYISNLLSTSFPNIAKTQVEAFVHNLCSNSSDPNKFRENLRDFLVQLKEFSSQDNDELYRDEQTLQLQQQQRLAVPGLVQGAHDSMAD